MAVNKETSPRGESVGDKVDAIIIGSMNSQEEDPVIVETPIRRSKRLSKKSDDESKKSKDIKSSPKEKEKKSKDPSSAEKKKKKSKSENEGEDDNPTSNDVNLIDNNEDVEQPPKLHKVSSTKAQALFVTPTLTKPTIQSPSKPNASTTIALTKQSNLPQPKARSQRNLTSKLQAPKSRRLESKLQGPGSFRTGKQISAIPSESEAKMSPLKSLPVPQVSEDEDQNMPSKANDSHISRVGKAAKKAVSTGRVTTHTSPIKASPKKPLLHPAYIHGGTESASWESQISELREDTEAEYAYFREQNGDEMFDYDMRIRVVVRKRPLSKKEKSSSGGMDVIHPLDYNEFGKILVYQPKTRVDLTKEVETVPFAFDNVYGESSTNVEIYQRSLRNLIYPFFKGQWSTVFAYGQTGSGKTYTMMGSNMTGMNAGTASVDTSNLGLYYLAALDIFDMVKRPEYSHLTVQVSLFEIYGGKLFDLLNGRNQIKCLEDSKGKVCFPGLTEHPVEGPDNLMEVIEEGALNRSTGTTSRNADSSRSHAVLQLKLRKDIGRKKHVEHGKF